MIQLKGYNTKLEKEATLLVSDFGAVITEDWNNIEYGSVKLYTGKTDCDGNMLFEDDEIVSELNGVHMTIRYGEHEAFCPEDHCIMTNVGFYVEADGYENMPLGSTEEYAKKDKSEHREKRIEEAAEAKKERTKMRHNRICAVMSDLEQIVRQSIFCFFMFLACIGIIAINNKMFSIEEQKIIANIGRAVVLIGATVIISWNGIGLKIRNVILMITGTAVFLLSTFNIKDSNVITVCGYMALGYCFIVLVKTVVSALREKESMQEVAFIVKTSPIGTAKMKSQINKTEDGV